MINMFKNLFTIKINNQIKIFFKNLIPSIIVMIFLVLILKIYCNILGVIALIPIISGIGSVLTLIIKFSIKEKVCTVKSCIITFIIGVILSALIIYIIKNLLQNYFNYETIYYISSLISIMSICLSNELSMINISNDYINQDIYKDKFIGVLFNEENRGRRISKNSSRGRSKSVPNPVNDKLQTKDLKQRSKSCPPNLSNDEERNRDIQIKEQRFIENVNRYFTQRNQEELKKSLYYNELLTRITSKNYLNDKEIKMLIYKHFLIKHVNNYHSDYRYFINKHFDRYPIQPAFIVDVNVPNGIEQMEFLDIYLVDLYNKLNFNKHDINNRNSIYKDIIDIFPKMIPYVNYNLPLEILILELNTIVKGELIRSSPNYWNIHLKEEYRFKDLDMELKGQGLKYSRMNDGNSKEIRGIKPSSIALNIKTYERYWSDIINNIDKNHYQSFDQLPHELQFKLYKKYYLEKVERYDSEWKDFMDGYFYSFLNAQIIYYENIVNPRLGENNIEALICLKSKTIDLLLLFSKNPSKEEFVRKELYILFNDKCVDSLNFFDHKTLSINNNISTRHVFIKYWSILIGESIRLLPDDWWKTNHGKTSIYLKELEAEIINISKAEMSKKNRK